MPNNSSARREKGKKKQDKRKNTVPPPLHKEDKACKDKTSKDSIFLSFSEAGEDEVSMDRISLFLSSDRKVTVTDLADPRFLERVLLMELRCALWYCTKRPSQLSATFQDTGICIILYMIGWKLHSG